MRPNRDCYALKLLYLLVAGSLLVCEASGQEYPGRRPIRSADEFVRRRLEADDRDGDGAISKTEASGQLARFFERVDSNDDDVVDRSERTRSGTTSIRIALGPTATRLVPTWCLCWAW